MLWEHTIKHLPAHMVLYAKHSQFRLQFIQLPRETGNSLGLDFLEAVTLCVSGSASVSL